MYLLYLDESGSDGNEDEAVFVLAGIAAFEPFVSYLSRKLTEIMAEFEVAIDAELHGNAILKGNGRWRKSPREKRALLIKQALSALAECNARKNCFVFGVAIERAALAEGETDILEVAFEQITSRFNKFIRRKKQEHGDQAQRGVIVMDKTKDEKKLQNLTDVYRESGTQWGNLRNLAEVPLFADSKASRLIQLADLVAYSLWQYYVHADASFFNEFADFFDQHDGKIHGLHHKTINRQCPCPACLVKRLTRRKRSPQT